MVRSTSDLHGNVRAERSKDEERNTSVHRVDACRIRCRTSGTCRIAKPEQAARELIGKRNSVMHRHLGCLKDEALNAMEQLGVVLQEFSRMIASDA